MKKPMTLAVAKQICRDLGFTLVNDREWNQYIVKPAGARNDHPKSYFTNDLADAVATARAMWAHDEWRKVRDAIGSDLAALLGPN